MSVCLSVRQTISDNLSIYLSSYQTIFYLSIYQIDRQTDNELSWWHGTRSWWQLAERSRCLLAMSEAGVTQSVRYCGALCFWHRRTVMPSLYCTRSGTSSHLPHRATPQRNHLPHHNTITCHTARHHNAITCHNGQLSSQQCSLACNVRSPGILRRSHALCFQTH